QLERRVADFGGTCHASDDLRRGRSGGTRRHVERSFDRGIPGGGRGCGVRAFRYRAERRDATGELALSGARIAEVPDARATLGERGLVLSSERIRRISTPHAHA